MRAFMRAFIKRKSSKLKRKSYFLWRRTNTCLSTSHSTELVTEEDSEVANLKFDTPEDVKQDEEEEEESDAQGEADNVQDSIDEVKGQYKDHEESMEDSSIEKTNSINSNENGNKSSSSFESWAGSLRRQDPRVKIEKFFNTVAQEGNNFGSIAKAEDVALRDLTTDLCFEKSSIFTVWRPTSLDAIRRMMLGEGVGKGLDIKGKSAKKGILSAFVPFVQIHEEKHKSMVQTLPKGHRMRVFYETKKARETALSNIRIVASDMVRGHKEAMDVLEDPKYTSVVSPELALIRSMEWDLANPIVDPVNNYAPECFGLEVSMRLFWEACITRQDISRKAGSDYETGRPSEPAFQGMNFRSMKNRAKSDDYTPPVVYQHASSNDNPMCPQSLLMAYEENGRVSPVVSDFDCFLTGSKRVHFNEPLSKEQLGLVKWSVKQIKIVLDTQAKEEPETPPLSWTKCWLKVLQEATSKGFHPTMPKFGFGDPRSYSIVEHAVERLQDDGCVRHGAECFNYYFPQELDDQFLVISKILPGNVPWKYMNATELQEFLGARVDEGFTFPLNPKWVLCDPGWKCIYDKLLESKNSTVQDSMGVWYPHESGIRDEIEKIHEVYPEGFKRKIVGPRAANASSQEEDDENEGTYAMDLATLELNRYMAKKRARLKLRACFLFNLALAKKK